MLSQAELEKFIRLSLRRESLTKSSPRRDEIDEVLEPLWLRASEKQQRYLSKFLNELHGLLVSFEETPA